MSGFQALCATLGASIRGAEAHADCPSCGKPAKPGQNHFMFNEGYARCWVCGYGASTVALARRLGAGDFSPLPPRPLSRPRPPRHWQLDPERYVREFCAAPDRFETWGEYRPLTDSTIEAWQLGVGRLPSSKCEHPRLTVPIRRQGKVVGLAGRAFCCPPECAAAKWTLAGGSEFALFNLDFVSEGSTVIVVENRADAILACQEWPEYVTVAKGSANVWRREWTERFLERRPEFVLFWPDNDEAGYQGAARGANELLEAGLVARVRQWSEAAPAKCDLGTYIMAEIEERDAA